MRHFWNWVKNADETRTLFLEGVIAEESWFSDEVTPAMFKEELFAGSCPILLHINSPGGDCIAASQIYTMLMDYPHDITVQIDGMAASAASVIAMAGTKVCMSPTSMMMIHNPFTCAMGDSDEMRKAIQLLDEVKESIINAYEIKTGLSRTKLSHLMDSETWMNAMKAKELGFCDEVLYTGTGGGKPDDVSGFSFARRTADACLMNRVIAAMPRPAPVEPEPESAPVEPEPEPTVPVPEPEPDNRVKAADLEKRLALLK
jgi:ATP-dependent Clp protease protease subunit